MKNPTSGSTLQQPGVRFLLLGIASFLLTLGATAFFHELANLAEETAYLLAILIVFVCNFFGARIYVFESRHKPILKQFTQFAGSSLLFRGAEYLAFILLHTLLGLYYLLATVIVMTVSFICKYLFYKTRVFTREESQD